MDDTKITDSAAGVTRSELEARVSELERRLARLEARPAAPDDRHASSEAELAQLREAVRDLGADALDLHNQLAKVVSSFERILAGAGGEGLSVRSKGRLGRVAAFAGRAARRVARGTEGAARRLRRTRPRERAEPLRFDLELAAAPVRSGPRIVLVVRSSEDPEAAEIPTSLLDQTEPELVVVVWNEDTATAALLGAGGERRVVPAPDRSAVAAAVDAELVGELAPPLPRLHPTTIERCRWTAASEGLPLVVAGTQGASSARPWTLQRVTDWLGSAAVSSVPSGARLAKMVGGSGWGALDRLGSQVVGAGAGRCYVVPAGTAGPLTHRVFPLAGVVTPHPASDGRLPVLVVTSASGGELAAWLARHLGPDHRLTVAVTGAGEATPLLRGLTGLADRVYPLEGSLEPEVWPSLVADLARAHEVRAIVRIGAAVALADGEHRPRTIDVPLDPSQVDDRADLVLALGSAIAEKARTAGVDVLNLVPGPVPAGQMPRSADSAGVRAAYGVPGDSRLVVSICDLEPANRPEDVAAVARRLRDREDVQFLLVGTGSLAGSISDLAGYFELERFAFAPPGHALHELVAASDCVLHTAEVAPWPAAVGAGLALGRGVVATDVDGVRELVEAADGDRGVLCRPGDVDALAAAVVTTLDHSRKPRSTRKAWNAAVARSDGAARTFRESIARFASEESESR